MCLVTLRRRRVAGARARGAPRAIRGPVEADRNIHARPSDSRPDKPEPFIGPRVPDRAELLRAVVPPEEPDRRGIDPDQLRWRPAGSGAACPGGRAARSLRPRAPHGRACRHSGFWVSRTRSSGICPAPGATTSKRGPLFPTDWEAPSSLRAMALVLSPTLLVALLAEKHSAESIFICRKKVSNG